MKMKDGKEINKHVHKVVCLNLKSKLVPVALGRSKRFSLSRGDIVLKWFNKPSVINLDNAKRVMCYWLRLQVRQEATDARLQNKSKLTK